MIHHAEANVGDEIPRLFEGADRIAVEVPLVRAQLLQVLFCHGYSESSCLINASVALRATPAQSRSIPLLNDTPRRREEVKAATRGFIDSTSTSELRKLFQAGDSLQGDAGNSLCRGIVVLANVFDDPD